MDKSKALARMTWNSRLPPRADGIAMTSTANEWTPEAKTAIELCQDWAADVCAKIPCDIYLFGSAIYQSGDQFDAQLSDLDIIIVLRDEPDITKRVERLERLQGFKFNLELQLIPALHRENCVEPGVSVVPITTIELETNIHKSGVRRFFDKNIFLNLTTEKQLVGLPNAGIATLPEESRQALEYVQELRNQFLAVSANATGG